MNPNLQEQPDKARDLVAKYGQPSKSIPREDPPGVFHFWPGAPYDAWTTPDSLHSLRAKQAIASWWSQGGDPFAPNADSAPPWSYQPTPVYVVDEVVVVGAPPGAPAPGGASAPSATADPTAPPGPGAPLATLATATKVAGASVGAAAAALALLWLLWED